MITFSPIHKNIQETLLKKMDMLDRNISSYSIGSTRATDDGNTNENYMFARSVFLRMTSLLTYNDKPIIIMGGEMREGKFKSGYADLYGKRSTTSSDRNKMKRPIAGIKDISVEYKGGGLRIGATRTTSVSWTCWTWEELQRFKPFFLKHGRSVLIEFGWSFSGADKPIMLDIIYGEEDDEETGKLKKNLLKGEDGRSLSEILPEHILRQKGHYDAVLGTIQNFEFTVNDTGGFDCTTNIVSLGVTTLQKMNSKENMMGSISRLPIIARKGGGITVMGLDFFQSDEFLTSIDDKNPYYNFVAYMKSLQGHLHKNAEASKGTIVYLDTDFEPYCTWGWFEDNVLSRFISIVNEKHEVVTEFRSIENVYDDAGNIDFVQPIKIRNSKDILPTDFEKWIFLNNEDGTLFNGFTNLVGSDILDLKFKYGPGFKGSDLGLGNLQQKQWIEHFGKIPEEADDKSFRVFTVIKEPNNATIDETQYGVSAEGTGNSYLINEDEQKEASKKSVTPNFNQKEGILRNVYFHWKFLMNSFVEASTIRGGIEKVWDTFSAEYGGIYNFVIDFDDKEGRLLIRDKGFSENSVVTVLENTSKNPNTSVYDNKGVFVFPIWEKNSMVKSQTLNAKIPDRMQVAAMYGSNKPEFEDGIVDNYDEWGGIALGKAEKDSEKKTLHIFEKEAKRQDLYDSLIGSMEHAFKRGEPKINDKGEVIESGLQYTFGNASANITKKLQWAKGNESNSNTTGIYEDLKKEGGISGYHDMVLGINEVLNEQLKGEYQSRLKESIGLNEEGNLLVDENILSADGIADIQKIWRLKDGTGQESGFWNNIYTGIGHQTKGKLTKPKMKAEYAGMMRVSLKDTDGLLKQSDPIIPIELEIEIDGIGGIFPGNTFHSSYLPQSYMDRICFQVKGASQKVDATGWTTTLQGQMRVGAPEFVPKLVERRAPIDRKDIVGLRDDKGNVIPVSTVSTAQPAGESVFVYTAEGTTTAELEAEGLNEEQIEEFKNKTEFLDSNKSEDGTQIEVITYTVAIDKSAVVIDYQAHVDYGTATGEAAIEAQMKIATEISLLNGHWEVEHLMGFAENADLYLPDLHMTDGGVTFLTWFQDNMSDSSIIPTGWFNRDEPAIQDAYAVWWALQESIQPGVPEGGWPTTPLPDYLNLFGDG